VQKHLQQRMFAEFTLYRRVGLSKMFLACSSTVYNYVEPEIWVSFAEESF